MASPRSGCRGTITVSSLGKIAGERPVGFRQDFFLAGMRGGREHDRAAARHRHQHIQLVRIGRRGGNVELEVSRHHDVAAAQRRKAIRIGLRLRQADVELAKQRRDGPLDPLPARKRALRHPSVDQHHRQPPRGARQDQVRPQVGFDEQRQRGPPVIEKPRDVTRRVVGHILMDDVSAGTAWRRSQPRSPCPRSGGCAGSSARSRSISAAAASTSPTLAP